MEQDNFQNLINKEKYQVFIFSCPAYFPVNFARHPWFVVNKKGKISRWEIKHFKNKKGKNLFVNNQLPFQGINITFGLNIFWKARLFGYIEGDENSNAHKIADFIENSENNYPFCNKYSLLGPNSNTYVQNVLDNFPEFNVKLGGSFIGKDYKIK